MAGAVGFAPLLYKRYICSLAFRCGCCDGLDGVVSNQPSCCCLRKHVSCPPLPDPGPFCLSFVPTLCPLGWELTPVSPSVHLLRPLWPGGLPGPGLPAHPQGHPSWCLAAGAGRQQPEPYRHSGLRRAVVTTGAGVDRMPDTKSWTSGGKFRRHLQLSENNHYSQKKTSTSPFYPHHSFCRPFSLCPFWRSWTSAGTDWRPSRSTSRPACLLSESFGCNTTAYAN